MARCTSDHSNSVSLQVYVYAGVFLVAAAALHPELKAFYHRGGGAMKNTTSFIDSLAAAVTLMAASATSELAKAASANNQGPVTLVVRSPLQAPEAVGQRAAGAVARTRVLLGKCRQVALPAIGVFCVIVLSTLANFLSFQVWIVLGPAEIIFTVPLARCLQGVRLRPMQLVAVAMAAVGSLCFAWSKLRGSSSSAVWTAAGAVAVTLLCRACQSLQTVLLRNACRRLGVGRPKAVGEDSLEPLPELQSSVLEIAALKMCVVSALLLPYALATEGFAPWSKLASSVFWTDAEGGLLLGSIVITVVFHVCNVGLNAEVGSLIVVLVTTTLTPLAGLAIIWLLASGGKVGQALGRWLGFVKSPQLSGAEYVGVALLAASLVVFFLGGRLQPGERHGHLSTGDSIEVERHEFLDAEAAPSACIDGRVPATS